MGTPALAARILDRLISHKGPEFEVVAAVTRPDRPRGRGLTLEACEVAAMAERYNLPVLKPEKIRTEEFLRELKSFEPDLLVVVAYGRILPTAVLEAPRLMPVNIHASILPRYRGAAPIEAALLAGDPVTGVTIMRITEQMDAGPILLQREIPIAPEETQATLKSKLAELGAQAMLEALALFARGEIRELAQDESQVSYCRPVKKEDAIIDWRIDARQIEAMTRAYNPWPIARTKLGGQELLIYRAAVEDRGESDNSPGTIVRVEPVPLVQCGIGALSLLEVQAPGRKRMAAGDFMRGRRITAGQRFSQ